MGKSSIQAGFEQPFDAVFGENREQVEEHDGPADFLKFLLLTALMEHSRCVEAAVFLASEDALCCFGGNAAVGPGAVEGCGAGKIGHPVDIDLGRTKLVVKADGGFLIFQTFTRQTCDVVHGMVDVEFLQIANGSVHLLGIALSLHLGQGLGIHRLHADSNHGAACFLEHLCHGARHGLGVGIALEREADVP